MVVSLLMVTRPMLDLLDVLVTTDATGRGRRHPRLMLPAWVQGVADAGVVTSGGKGDDDGSR
ncbi:hypothetical protein E2562_026069, partial [Oryza meyeriana var. granulata]